MIKQIIVVGITAVGLLLSAQASAGQQSSHGKVKVWVSNSQGVGKHTKPRHRVKKFNVNLEQRQQARMIKRGIKSCRITPREARRLNKQQRRIKKTERRMRRNGLQRWERKQLKRSLSHARAKITRLTNNRKTCGGHRHHHKKHGGHRKHH